MKTIQEEIDRALQYGKEYGLDDKQIENLIKAFARNKYGDDANKELSKFGLCISDKDGEGIEEAEEFLGRILEEFMDEFGDEKIIAVLRRRKQERRAKEKIWRDK